MTEENSTYLNVAIYRIIGTNALVMVIIKVLLLSEDTMQKTNIFFTRLSYHINKHHMLQY